MATTATYRLGGPTPASRGAVLVPCVVGALVSVALGVYGSVHAPTGRTETSVLVWTVEMASSSAMLAFKSWLTTLALVLGVAQLLTALRLRGVVQPARPAPLWLGDVHRLLGTTTLIVAIPVAYHCLWALGFSSADPRILLHSVVGCALFGAFAAKVLGVHRDTGPRWLVPALGAALLSAVVLVWTTSALAYFTGRLGG